MPRISRKGRRSTATTTARMNTSPHHPQVELKHKSSFQLLAKKEQRKKQLETRKMMQQDHYDGLVISSMPLSGSSYMEDDVQSFTSDGGGSGSDDAGSECRDNHSHFDEVEERDSIPAPQRGRGFIGARQRTLSNDYKKNKTADEKPLVYTLYHHTNNEAMVATKEGRDEPVSAAARSIDQDDDARDQEQRRPSSARRIGARTAAAVTGVGAAAIAAAVSAKGNKAKLADKGKKVGPSTTAKSNRTLFAKLKKRSVKRNGNNIEGANESNNNEAAAAAEAATNERNHAAVQEMRREMQMSKSRDVIPHSTTSQSTSRPTDLITFVPSIRTMRDSSRSLSAIGSHQDGHNNGEAKQLPEERVELVAMQDPNNGKPFIRILMSKPGATAAGMKSSPKVSTKKSQRKKPKCLPRAQVAAATTPNFSTPRIMTEATAVPSTWNETAAQQKPSSLTLPHPLDGAVGVETELKRSTPSLNKPKNRLKGVVTKGFAAAAATTATGLAATATMMRPSKSVKSNKQQNSPPPSKKERKVERSLKQLERRQRRARERKEKVERRRMAATDESHVAVGSESSDNANVRTLVLPRPKEERNQKPNDYQEISSIGHSESTGTPNSSEDNHHDGHNEATESVVAAETSSIEDIASVNPSNLDRFVDTILGSFTKRDEEEEDFFDAEDVTDGDDDFTDGEYFDLELDGPFDDEDDTIGDYTTATKGLIMAPNAKNISISESVLMGHTSTWAEALGWQRDDSEGTDVRDMRMFEPARDARDIRLVESDDGDDSRSTASPYSYEDHPTDNDTCSGDETAGSWYDDGTDGEYDNGMSVGNKDDNWDATSSVNEYDDACNVPENESTTKANKAMDKFRGHAQRLGVKGRDLFKAMSTQDEDDKMNHNHDEEYFDNDFMRPQQRGYA